MHAVMHAGTCRRTAHSYHRYPRGQKCASALRNPRSSRAAGQPQPSNLRGFKAPLVMSFVLSCKVATDTQVQFTIKCTFASIVAARRDAIAGPPPRAQETSMLRNSRAQRLICRAPKRAAAMPEPRAPSRPLPAYSPWARAWVRGLVCSRGSLRLRLGASEGGGQGQGRAVRVGEFCGLGVRPTFWPHGYRPR